ncbi:Aflatoxin biosynthesis regulatory protein [Cercospora beticola]|uniref:Aflatoxin biosynthesis regulatory protein n=1 Tax=Cercospora beticola TaxID=122368 RepID=A0A2G5I821_CERBT|nr:Aflatoxin biosynthesis regulatory protein [Cercospora beticola]PIB00654.1 Aflatoxin biosynthesis regulatory protein [Cercospora beticola]WPA96337.1 hypothetical protein RHO25_000944 [Cercospora beticola]
MPERTSSGGAARSRETVKLRDSCEICASAKVRCSKEKPSCSRCINRGLKCEYGLSRRNGRSATNNNSSSSNRDQDQSYGTHVKPPVAPVRRDSGDQNRQIEWTTDMVDVSTEDPHLTALSQPMPHSMPTYPQTAPMSVPFTQEVPDLNVSMLPNETNMDLFMMNSDVTTWTDIQPPWAAAACEPDHCCLNTALDLLRQLSITEASKACPRRGMPEQIPPPTLEMAATMNRTIIASLNTILGCSCSLNGNLLTIISLVTFKLIAWCASAAKNTPRADSPMATAETMGSNAPIALKDLLRSPPAGLDGLMDAVGATGNEQIQAAAQTVLDDLYRVQDLVNLFSQRLNMARRRRSAVGGGSAGSDIQAAMYNTSTTLSESVSAQLESDLRRRLRAVSFETVQILLRG